MRKKDSSIQHKRISTKKSPHLKTILLASLHMLALLYPIKVNFVPQVGAVECFPKSESKWPKILMTTAG